MPWKRITAFVIVLALIVSALALPRVSHVLNQESGDLIRNSNEAYVFISVAQYGYNFSYLGFLIDIVKEIFPFGASAPDNLRVVNEKRLSEFNMRLVFRSRSSEFSGRGERAS
jgi:hypothetical protein